MSKEKYRERLSALGIPKSAVAGIAGVSPGEISHYFRDASWLSVDRRAAIEKALEDCIALQTAARNEFPPAIVINWKDSKAVRGLIAWFREQIAAQTFLSHLEAAQQESLNART